MVTLICARLSKASDIQAPLTESHHHHHNRHHSTISAAGGACSEKHGCRGRGDGAQDGNLLWSHAESKYNTASYNSAGSGRGHPQGDTGSQKSRLYKVLVLQTILRGRAALIKLNVNFPLQDK